MVKRKLKYFLIVILLLFTNTIFANPNLDQWLDTEKTYKDLINTGMGSLDTLAELARESEHPRAFEVLSRAIKDVADTTEKLMALQADKKKLSKEDEDKEKAKAITNNNLFVGSTTDLQRMLLDHDKNIIDAED